MILSIHKTNLITYLLIFALIKPYFIPDPYRQVLKIVALLIVFLYLLLNSRRVNIVNFSLLFSGAVLISSLLALTTDSYHLRDFLDAVLYALSFYDLYTFCALSKETGEYENMIHSMFRIIFLYCVLTIISVSYVGVANNSNRAVYLFGNKFASSYLFVLMLALYGATRDMTLKRRRIVLVMLFVCSTVFTLYVGCATVTVVFAIMLVFNFLPGYIKSWFYNPQVICTILVLSAVIVLWIGQILKIDVVNNLVSGYFNKSYTITGRLQIYSEYLFQVIREKLFFGYGYSNSVMYNLTGVFSNAQNGLLEIVLNMGIVGAGALVATLYNAYKGKQHLFRTQYLSIVVYGMIIAAIFEVSLNWFFLIGVCLIKWNDEIIKKKV